MNHLERLYAARIKQMQIGPLRAEFYEAQTMIHNPSVRAAAALLETELKKRGETLAWGREIG